ncbi:MAG: molybdopterin converting factor, subunit 1 [Pseudomonadota bacterium]|jgi:molybdopterin synthase sulfur carrier subunit
MKVQVRYFASLRENMGTASEWVETSAQQVADLRQQLMDRGGVYAEALASHRPVRVAVNQVMAQDTTALQEGCEVAFFPPVTGG